MALPPIQVVLSRLVAERDVKVTGDVAYGPLPRHKLDIYEPPGGSGQQGPVAVFFYGGSWRGGGRPCYGFVGAALASQGITTIVPDYRLFPEVQYPAFMEDAALAFRWVGERIGEDENRRLSVVGHSAGAHMAALLALDSRYLATARRRPDRLIGLSGPYAFYPTRWQSTAEIFRPAPDADEPRPVTHVSAQAPLTLLIHGAADMLVKTWNVDEMAKAYGAAGLVLDTMVIPRFGHLDPLTTLARPLRWRAPVLRRIVSFLNGPTVDQSRAEHQAGHSAA